MKYKKKKKLAKSEDEECVDGENATGADSSDSSGINADAEAGISDNSY